MKEGGKIFQGLAVGEGERPRGWTRPTAEDGMLEDLTYDADEPTVIEPRPVIQVGTAPAPAPAPAVRRRDPFRSVPDESGVRRLDSIEVDVTELEQEAEREDFELAFAEAIEAAALAHELDDELDVDVDVDLGVEAALGLDGPQDLDPGRFAPVVLEVSIALETYSNFYRDLDGRLGVFHATYDPHVLGLEAGKPVWLTVQLPEGVCIESLGRVEWTRLEQDGGWPGVGLRLLSLEEHDHLQAVRFTSRRAPLFY